MDALSFKGFLVITAVAAACCAAVAALFCALMGQFIAPVMAGVTAGSMAMGLMVAGVAYLVQLAVEIRRLDFPADDLCDGEVVKLQSQGSMVHYRTGNPRRTFDAVGGKLFLTTHRLRFVAHRGQPWRYRLDVPLKDIEDAAPCGVMRGLRGGLEVTIAGGRRELFTFGAARAHEADQWSETIHQARDKHVAGGGPR